jgi:hypothetical protein
MIFRQLRICWCGAPSLTRSWVCSFQSLLGITSAVFLRSQSQGAHKHILLSPFLRLPQPGGSGSHIYIPQVQVILRPTVSRPVRFDVGPLQVQWPDFNFLCLTILYSSCRAPSLKRGKICNLKYNHSLNHSPPLQGVTVFKPKLRYDWRSVSMSWCRAHPGTCDQILLVLPVRGLPSESCCLVSVECPLWREVGSVIYQSQPAVIVSMHIEHLHFIHPVGTGWPSYTPGHWVPFSSPLTARSATTEIF